MNKINDVEMTEIVGGGYWEAYKTLYRYYKIWWNS
jgi:hypothetical protein